MATQTASAPTGVTLTDSKLFRQQCYIDGAWVDARSGGTISVDNPATGEIIGTVPKVGTAETREAIEAADRASCVAQEDRQGARRGPAPVVRPDDGATRTTWPG